MAEGKGVIPYELIIGMESFILTPANDFWEKTEFFSELKQSVVNDNDYANSKYLYKNNKFITSLTSMFKWATFRETLLPSLSNANDYVVHI